VAGRMKRLGQDGMISGGFPDQAPGARDLPEFDEKSKRRHRRLTATMVWLFTAAIKGIVPRSGGELTMTRRHLQRRVAAVAGQQGAAPDCHGPAQILDEVRLSLG